MKWNVDSLLMSDCVILRGETFSRDDCNKKSTVKILVIRTMNGIEIPNEYQKLVMKLSYELSIQINSSNEIYTKSMSFILTHGNNESHFHLSPHAIVVFVTAIDEKKVYRIIQSSSIDTQSLSSHTKRRKKKPTHVSYLVIKCIKKLIAFLLDPSLLLAIYLPAFKSPCQMRQLNFFHLLCVCAEAIKSYRAEKQRVEFPSNIICIIHNLHLP